MATTQYRGRAPRTRAKMIDQLAESFEVDENGCWLWTGKLTTAGYGAASWKRGERARLIAGAHRVVLAAVGLSAPEDMVVDHLCRVRHCINPDHLEPVLQRENVMRSPIAPGALNAAKTECAHGHPFDEENTYWVQGKGFRGRRCRTCLRGRAA